MPGDKVIVDRADLEPVVAFLQHAPGCAAPFGQGCDCALGRLRAALDTDPEQLVEKMARAIFESPSSLRLGDWPHIGAYTQERYRRMARAALSVKGEGK